MPHASRLRSKRAGTPATIAPASTPFVTTAPAATTAPSPIVTPPRITEQDQLPLARNHRQFFVWTGIGHGQQGEKRTYSTGMCAPRSSSRPVMHETHNLMCVASVPALDCFRQSYVLNIRSDSEIRHLLTGLQPHAACLTAYRFATKPRAFTASNRQTVHAMCDQLICCGCRSAPRPGT